MRREVAAVDIHAFDILGFIAHRAGFFDGDCALRADLVEHIGYQRAHLVFVSGKHGNLPNLLVTRHGHGHSRDFALHRIDRAVDAYLERHRVRARRHVLEALLYDALRENGRCGRAVAYDVVRLACRHLDELSADILERLYQLDFLGDGYAVATNQRRTELLVQHDIAPAWAKSSAYRLRQRAYAVEELAPSLFTILELLCHLSHLLISLSVRQYLSLSVNLRLARLPLQLAHQKPHIVGFVVRLHYTSCLRWLPTKSLRRLCGPDIRLLMHRRARAAARRDCFAGNGACLGRRDERHDVSDFRCVDDAPDGDA